MLKFKERGPKKIDLSPITGNGNTCITELKAGDIVTADTSGFSLPLTILAVNRETAKMVFFLVKVDDKTFEKSYLKTTCVDLDIIL